VVKIDDVAWHAGARAFADNRSRVVALVVRLRTAPALISVAFPAKEVGTDAPRLHATR
jgi:hypothetical protein